MHQAYPTAGRTSRRRREVLTLSQRGTAASVLSVLLVAGGESTNLPPCLNMLSKVIQNGRPALTLLLR